MGEMEEANARVRPAHMIQLVDRCKTSMIGEGPSNSSGTALPITILGTYSTMPGPESMLFQRPIRKEQSDDTTRSAPAC
jgi:hypothetical protein